MLIVRRYSLRDLSDQAVDIVFREDGYEFGHREDLTRPATTADRADRCVPKIPFSFWLF
jgi:hypothetical protein